MFNVSYNAKQIEKTYLKIHQKMIETISDEEIVSKLLTDAFDFTEFRQIADLPFGMVVYEHDSAVIWTNNHITPVQVQSVLNDQPVLITEANGSYIIAKHEFSHSQIKTIGFLPLRFEYGINNQYLNNIKNEGINIPTYFRILSEPTENSEAIHAPDGSDLFYIDYASGASFVPHFNFVFYLLISATFVILLILIYNLSELIGRNWFPLSGIIVCGILLIAFLQAIQYFISKQILSSFALFDPTFYASAGFASSIGNLLLKVSALFVFSIYFLTHFHEIQIKKFKFVFSSISAIVISLLAFFILFIFKSLVIDSSINFDIHHFFDLNYISFAGIICISTALLSFVLFAIKLLDFISSRYSSAETFLFVLSSALVCFALQYFFFQSRNFDAVILICSFSLLRIFMRAKKLALRSLPSLLIWLVFFSTFSAHVFNQTLWKKSEENKKLFADRKAIEKDDLAEFLFNENQKELTRTLLLQLAIKDTGQYKQRIVNQVRFDLQNNYFKKYDADIFLFKDDSLLVSTEKESTQKRNYFIDAIENNGEFTSAQNLYFINDNTGNYYYLAELFLKEDSLAKEIAYIRLIPKRITNQSLYPELLIDEDINTLESYENFDYAIYNDHSLIERKGEYSYPIMDVFYVEKNEDYSDQHINGYHHLVYRVSDTKKVVVSQQDRSILEPFSYFSYLFFIFLTFLGSILLIDFVVRILKGKINIREKLNTTLQNKIQVSAVSLIVFAFIIMGIATIIYITNQYNKSHKQRLLTKIEAVQTNIDYIFDETKRKNISRGTKTSIMRRITSRAAELSEIHDMDINIYAPSGELITSSQPDIFLRGLVSTKMNPLAYFKMTCDKETWYIQDEHIGKLKYLSAYVPIMDNTGEVLFYLNLPYFATEQNLRAEISSFMVALINVYVLLLVIASILAFAVSQSITKPLSVIAGTFKNIKLGKKNESIVWNHHDEIGLLVEEYNAMIKELEKSANLLAQNERESAWRDMAKQVAHEIKNPLTPMRLSIQHLQRALQTNAPNAKELTEKVTKTLLEQIDNLSFIASEFSNFAIMPKAQNELLCINQVLENTVNLFDEIGKAEISMQIPDKEIYVFADKNQLIRVFNNILKNAIQAIPDDRNGEIEIVLEQKINRALIRIKDNGSGISEEQKEKVFNPNFTTKSSGMGIGLSMTKNIIESAGGYIWFESVEGTGTEFFIEFPISAE